MDVLLSFGLLAALLCAGFFAGLEAAFRSLNGLAVEWAGRRGEPNAAILEGFLKESSALIATLTLGFILSLTAYGLLAVALFDLAWERMAAGMHTDARPILTLPRMLLDLLLCAIPLVTLTFLCRALFRTKGDSLLRMLARPARFLHRCLGGSADRLSMASAWLLRNLFDARIGKEKPVFPRNDPEAWIRHAGEAGDRDGGRDARLLKAALSLPSLRIRQCLVPRREVEAVEIGAGIERMRERFTETKLSRLLVYENDIDNILGYVHQLALFRKPADIRSVLLPIPAIPESMGAADLVRRLSRERRSIAWVVDEFGGTAGIITLEDLLEEVFGEIRDEHDTEELVEQRLSADEYLLAGRHEIDYLNGKYGLGIPREASETLSGFIIAHHESIPAEKERIIIDRFEFEVLQLNENRIETVRMKVLE